MKQVTWQALQIDGVVALRHFIATHRAHDSITLRLSSASTAIASRLTFPRPQGAAHARSQIPYARPQTQQIDDSDVPYRLGSQSIATRKATLSATPPPIRLRRASWH